MNIIWNVQDFFENLWKGICMISQVQTASASIGRPITAWKAYKILFGAKA